MWKWLLPVVLALALPAPAHALMKSGSGIVKRGLNVATGPAATTSVFPGDAVTFTAFWGIRPMTQAQCTGFVDAIRLRRASDNLEQSINIKTDCDLNTGLASTHCAATTCFVVTLFDQAGSNHMTQATQANQPSWVWNCLGLVPCIQTANSTAIMLTATNPVTPATGVTSLHYVGNRSGTASGTSLVNSNGPGAAGNRLATTGSVNNWSIFGGTSGSVGKAAADGAWHVGAGLITGTAASVMYVDGVAGATVTAIGSTTAGAPSFGRAGTTSTQQSLEGGFVDNVVISQGQVEALNAGARAVYGIP